jgi:hypothetical protein
LNRPRLIAFLVSALATGAALWFYLAQPPRMHAVAPAAPGAPASELAVAPVPVPTPLPIPTPTPVPIQDGKTLDFSGGAAAVKDTTADKAALDQGLKEIDDATKSITFPAHPAPTPTPTP